MISSTVECLVFDMQQRLLITGSCLPARVKNTTGNASQWKGAAPHEEERRREK